VAGLAVVGEIVEFAASAAGVKKLGGSWLGAMLALVGSVLGSIVGIFGGIPIPLVGSLVAALLFGGIGALAGAIIGETMRGQSMESSVEIGKAAFWGRLLGTLGKTLVGAIMAGVVIVSVLVK